MKKIFYSSKIKNSKVLIFSFAFLVTLLSGILFTFFLYFILNHLGLWSLGGTVDNDLMELQAVTLVVLTGGLISVAYVQLSSASKSLRGEFLLKIDERFTSHEFLEAETIIHQLCCAKGVKGIEDTQQIKLVSDEIANMSKQAEKSRDFNLLLNFLDFLETIAYMSNQDLILSKDVQELLGGTLDYYYKIFQSLIQHQNEYLKQVNYYCELNDFCKKKLKT